MLQSTMNETLLSVANPMEELPVPREIRRSFSIEAIRHFDSIATNYSKWKGSMRFYLDHNIEFLKTVVRPNSKVLLVGCMSPEVLESLNPSLGVGIDPSEIAVQRCSMRNFNPKIQYIAGQPEEITLEQKFDYILLLNVVDHCHDLFTLYGALKRFCDSDTLVISTLLNPLWHLPIRLASGLGIRLPDHKRNFVAAKLIEDALQIKQFRMTGVVRRVLLPRHFGFLSTFLNRYIARFPGFNALCFLQTVLARPNFAVGHGKKTASVIVPCFNEEGNIESCVKRIPQMGTRTEIVIVNDGSKDRTAEIATRLSIQVPNVKFVDLVKNQGKGAAVLAGLKAADGDIVMILDADMTVPPEELPEFFEAIDTGVAEFVSGTRFMYPMEKEAMRFANFIGNILFAVLVRIITGFNYSDTLCGTKAMKKSDFQDLTIKDRAWGDFDYIFHAATRRLKAAELPVHYRSRIFGESKMRAFYAGTIFLKLCLKKWAEIP